VRMGALSTGGIRRSVARARWTMDRFGVSPAKLPARLLNRTQPKVISISVPKAGTHLLERALCLHPRLYRKLVPTLNEVNLLRLGGLGRQLSRLGAGEILMAHLLHEPAHEQAIASSGVSSLIVIRDPRDVVVSVAHYVAATPNHNVSDVFSRQPTFKDQLLVAIRGDRARGMRSMGELLERFLPWLDGAGLVVRFEDLVGAAGGGSDAVRHATLRGVFEHIGMPADDALLASIAGRLFSDRSPTFRRGSIGEWHEAFDDDVQGEFDRIAGSYLGRYGYAHVP
jgi:sulfotransferase family protein